jgi:uncharacterized glyoxalase superfamily protein PhnB
VINATKLQASLTVADLPKSMKWYSDVIGFEIDQQHEREGKVRAARMSAGDVLILLNQEDGAKGWDRVKGQGISISFIISSGLDDIADRIKAAGVTLDAEPKDMPWGQRMFRLTDPDGFKLVFMSDVK